MNTKEKLLHAFKTYFFTVDGGAVLTHCNIDDRRIRVSESNENGEEWSVSFPIEKLEEAVIENDKVFIDDYFGDCFTVVFYPSLPVTL